MIRHRRVYLQPADLTAVAAPHRERQPARTVTLGDEFGERQHAPAVAPRAIGGDFVAVLEQAGEGAELDHARE